MLILYEIVVFKLRFVELIRAKYTTNTGNCQRSFIGADSSGEQCTGINPILFVGKPMIRKNSFLYSINI